jgi:hypothetical protein
MADPRPGPPDSESHLPRIVSTNGRPRPGRTSANASPPHVVPAKPDRWTGGRSFRVLLAPGRETRHVNSPRRITLEPAQQAGTATDQARCSDRIAALGVSDPYADLGQPLPEISLGRWSGLPDRLQNLVRGERPAAVQERLGECQRLLGRHRLFRNGFHALRVAVGQRPPQCVPRAALTRTTGQISISHASILPSCATSLYPAHAHPARLCAGRRPWNDVVDLACRMVRAAFGINGMRLIQRKERP